MMVLAGLSGLAAVVMTRLALRYHRRAVTAEAKLELAETRFAESVRARFRAEALNVRNRNRRADLVIEGGRAS
jgi:hypothetical protein